MPFLPVENRAIRNLDRAATPPLMSLPSVDIIKIDDTSVVSPNATIKGRVTIGAGCIIHPNASIIGHSPVELGANNIVEEQATIINTHQYVSFLIIMVHIHPS